MSGQGDELAVFFQVNSLGCSLGRNLGEPQNRPKYSGEEKTAAIRNWISIPLSSIPQSSRNTYRLKCSSSEKTE